jgi:hypothetical protein
MDTTHKILHGAAIGLALIAVAFSAIVLTHAPRQRVASSSWGELSQGEIDALTAILAKRAPHDVAIFCFDRGCDDIALDFDNALESAHWQSQIERPLVSSNVGIGVGPNNNDARALAAAISTATKGRLQPGLIEADVNPGRLVLDIGRKP